MAVPDSSIDFLRPHSLPAGVPPGLTGAPLATWLAHLDIQA